MASDAAQAQPPCQTQQAMASAAEMRDRQAHEQRAQAELSSCDSAGENVDGEGDAVVRTAPHLSCHRQPLRCLVSLVQMLGQCVECSIFVSAENGTLTTQCITSTMYVTQVYTYR